MADQREPIFARVPISQSRWLDQMHIETNLWKGDILSVLLNYSERVFTADDIKQMYDDFIKFGTTTLDIRKEPIGAVE